MYTKGVSGPGKDYSMSRECSTLAGALGAQGRHPLALGLRHSRRYWLKDAVEFCEAVKNSDSGAVVIGINCFCC